MMRFWEKEGVVQDGRTGLVWPREASLSEFPLSWAEALAFVENLNHDRYLGFADWRLPNRNQLFSLVSLRTINPCLPPGHPFENVFNGYYWTSTSCARLPDQAWYLHLGGARVFKGMKHGSYMVWPVRLDDDRPSAVLPTGQRLCHDSRGQVVDCRHSGQDGEFQSGQPLASPRFVLHPGYLRDQATGLTWLKNADWAQGPLDWESARRGIKQMNQARLAGFSDWRLPQIRELNSLIDLGRHSPALPLDHGFENVRDFYWSATTSRYDAAYAWVLYLRDGPVGVGHKPLPEFYLWPVRGGQSRP